MIDIGRLGSTRGLGCFEGWGEDPHATIADSAVWAADVAVLFAVSFVEGAALYAGACVDGGFGHVGFAGWEGVCLLEELVLEVYADLDLLLELGVADLEHHGGLGETFE